MNLYQIDIYAEVPHITAIQFRVKAATKEDVEAMARKFISDLGLPTHTQYIRSFIKEI